MELIGRAGCWKFLQDFEHMQIVASLKGMLCSLKQRYVVLIETMSVGFFFSLKCASGKYCFELAGLAHTV